MLFVKLHELEERDVDHNTWQLSISSSGAFMIGFTSQVLLAVAVENGSSLVSDGRLTSDRWPNASVWCVCTYVLLEEDTFRATFTVNEAFLKLLS